MRVLLTGGGTAGHINPALAIAETILMHEPDSEIIFVGNKKGKEVDLVPREGFALHFAKSKGISRKWKCKKNPRIDRVLRLAEKVSIPNLYAYWLAATEPYMPRVVKLLERFKPDVVIGTGGYACWPVMAAATRMGIPTAVHESNSLPGMAIRRLQGKVDMIWLNFPSTASRLTAQEKITRVGNPLRSGFGSISYEEARAQLGIKPGERMILSFGGSLGAEGISRAAIDAMRDYVAKDPKLVCVHATGKGDYARMKAIYDAYGLREEDGCKLVDYIYDMPRLMAAADLVVARAGAMTLSELARMKKAAILIPSRNVADDHQYLNAKELADAGAAVYVEEATLSEGTLTRAMRELLENPTRIAHMKAAISRFAVADANDQIWQKIKELTKKQS